MPTPRDVASVAALSQMQLRHPVLPRKVRRALQPAGQLSDDREDDRAVRIADVPFGSLQVGC